MSFEEFDWKKMVNEGTFCALDKYIEKHHLSAVRNKKKTLESQCFHPPFDTCCFYKWKRWRPRPGYRGNRRVKWWAVRIRLNLNAVSVFLLVFVKTVIRIIPLSQKFSFVLFLQHRPSCSSRVLIQIYFITSTFTNVYKIRTFYLPRSRKCKDKFQGRAALNFLQQRLLISAKSLGLTYY